MLFINKKKKKVAILYLCLGEDNDHFEEIHSACEKHLLHKVEKHYFVFTDDIKRYKMAKHVYPFEVPNLPEPLNEVMKIHHFLSKEDLYTGFDYIMILDPKYLVTSKVSDKDILPRSILTERFSFLLDHSKDSLKPEDYPYERNHESTAFVNYNRGKYYISDSLVIGEAIAFLEMCHTIDTNILEDLKNHYISDNVLEAHLNKYIVNLVDGRIIDNVKGLVDRNTIEVNEEELSDS